MMISITAPFLLFPTRRDAPLCKLHFLLAGQKVQEADVRLCAPDDADFVGCMDASAWFRQTLEVLSSDADDALLSGISVSAIYCTGRTAPLLPRPMTPARSIRAARSVTRKMRPGWEKTRCCSTTPRRADRTNGQSRRGICTRSA